MPAVVALANLTLGSNQASVAFSGFASSYRDLLIVASAGNSTGNASFALRFNSDTGSNYHIQTLGGSGGNPSSGRTAATTSIVPVTPSSEMSSTNQAQFQVELLDYSQTDRFKLAAGKAAGDNNVVYTYTGMWANTAAITSITLFPSSNSFRSGATFALYGVLG
jgi:hypothetical protein